MANFGAIVQNDAFDCGLQALALFCPAVLGLGNDVDEVVQRQCPTVSVLNNG